MKIRFTINHTVREVEVGPLTRLLDVIREDLGLTGTKEGCGEGECGACTVLIDGEAVASCLVPAIQADGAEILTIEGLSPDPEHLHPIQERFVQAGAVQCGFCTPGMVLSTKALLDANPRPNSAEIREAIAGNICRCTGYTKILDAIRLAADDLASGRRGGEG